MTAFKKYFLVVLFAVLLLGISIIDVLKPDSEFSASENRNLAKLPAFSWSSLVNGDFAMDYEEYVNDQFVGRNFWINAKSVGESVLGKLENNGIIYGKDHYLFEKLTSVDMQRVRRNIKSVAEFAELYSTNISLAVIPSSYSVLSHRMPYGADNIDQNPILDEIFSDAKKAGISVLDSRSILKENSDKYIFYKTDHHWTTLGAELVFSEYMNLLAFTPSDFSVYGYKSVSDFYGTSFYKCKLFSATADTINYYDIPVQSIEFDGETSDSLHDVEKFNTTDAYSGFIHGNNGITRIVSDCPDAEGSCLLVKDSYGNSFAPFLLTEFKEVVVVDLRYIPQKMSELMSSNHFDQVLILYSFSNFSNDINLSKLTF